MNCLIVEDEVTAARGLTKLLAQVDASINVLDVVESVSTAVVWLKSNSSPDLIFMDIHLKDGNSFEILDQVAIQSPIIFCTAYDEYALKAFKVNSIDYLLKPISKEDLGAALQKFHSFAQPKESNRKLVNLLNHFSEKMDTPKRFLIKIGSKYFHITLDKIAYFFKSEAGVYAKTFDGGKYLIDHTLEQLELMVTDAEFFRINRQFLISAKSFVSFESDYGTYPIKLDPDVQDQVLISRYRLNDFKDWLSR